MSQLSPALPTIFLVAAWVAAPWLAAPFAQAPAFEVVSLRLDTSGDANSGFSIRPGGTLVANNVPVRMLISAAYRLQPSQLAGGPDWLSTDRYDIVARAPAELTRETAEPLLRTVLAERFRLASHRERRSLPVYALVRARADGLGPRLVASSIDCSPAAAAARQKGEGAPKPAGRPICSVSNSATTIAGGGMSLTALAEALAPRLGRLVIDRSGLTGAFDFDIAFAGQQPGSPDDVSLETALQEQLGLRVESDRTEVEVMVVDSIERPTEN